MEKRKERIDHLKETLNSPLPYSDFGDSKTTNEEEKSFCERVL